MIIGHTVYLTAQGRSEIEAPTRTYPVVQFIHLKSRSVVFYREGNFDIALPDYVQGYLDACKTIGEIDRMVNEFDDLRRLRAELRWAKKSPIGNKSPCLTGRNR